MIETAELAAALAESGLAELHLTGPGTNIHLLRNAAQATPDAQIIAAPGVGILLLHHPLRATPLAEPGRRVRAGQTVALLRIGLLLRPVKAPTGGKLGPALAEEGAMVGYGAKLFHLHPERPETQA